jgi:hypothetical protein
MSPSAPARGFTNRPERGATAPTLRGQLRQAWPLTIYILGFPLWWALGLLAVVPMLAAFAMALQLLRRRTVHLPPGTSWLLLFVLWASFGVVLVFADAPGALPAAGTSALPAFLWRFSWYAACTIFLLWVANQPKSRLPDRLVWTLMSYMFLVTVVGGLAGVIFPTFEFTSPLEMLLPPGLRANMLVRSLAHPAVADIQMVLGRPEARPIAPFAFTNTWGSALALLMPFLVAVLATSRSWKTRVAGVAVLALAMVPVVYSLNRGLWICLAVGGAGLVALLVLKGRPELSAGALVAALLALVVFAVTPLADVFQERLENQHSNERRSLLVEATVSSVSSGSPVVGFGSTREVAGNFASIAGGGTADCDACGVPPLGTQGQLWVVLFQQGYVGAFCFLAFFAVALSRSWRCRTPNEIIATFSIGFLAVQMLVYDLVGPSLMFLVIAVALVAREQRESGEDRLATLRTAGRLGRDLRHAAVPVAVLALLGGAAGAAWTASRPDTYTSQVDLLLRPSAVSAVSPDTDTERLPEESSLDTEAALLVSQSALDLVTGGDADATEELRRRISISATPNTSLLRLAVTSPSADQADQSAADVASAYLDARRTELERRRDQVVDALRDQLRALDRRAAGDRGAVAEARRRIESDLVAVTISPVEAGEVVRHDPVVRVPGQYEVPVVTGAAIGVLAGLGLIGAVRVLRRRRS